VDKNEVAVVDLKTRKVTARWPVAPGGAPVGNVNGHQETASLHLMRPLIEVSFGEFPKVITKGRQHQTIFNLIPVLGDNSSHEAPELSA